MSDPEHIFLSPRCDECNCDREWCTEPGDQCDECNLPWVEYIRADLVTLRPEVDLRPCDTERPE